MNQKIDTKELTELLQTRKALSAEIARLEALRDGLVDEENQLLQSADPEDDTACAKLSALRARIDIFPARIAKLEADASQLDTKLKTASQVVKNALIGRAVERRESAIRTATNALLPFTGGEPIGPVVCMLPMIRNLSCKLEGLAMGFDRDASAVSVAEGVLLEVSR
jgi:hypothetical protein